MRCLEIVETNSPTINTMGVTGQIRHSLVFITVLLVAFCHAQTGNTSSVIDSDSDLAAAYHVIFKHSAVVDEDDVAHLGGLNDRKTLSRAIKLVLDSMKMMSNDTDLKSMKYRTFDGLGNNLDHPLWGAALQPELRLLPNSYDDKKGIPRHKGVSGEVLPSARDVSLACFKRDLDDPDHEDKYISQMFMQYGQFLDHDVILTEVENAANCCAKICDDGTHPDMFNGGTCIPVKTPMDDRHFNGCYPVKRSVGEVIKGVREQINAATSYVDLSQVYGPSRLMMEELRAGADGLLKVTSTNGLPVMDDMKCLRDSKVPKCPHAGDPRVNVFPGLTILHTMFHREHNRIAGELKKVNTHWDDEKLFQEARKINMAVNQRITYEEYLPKVLGPDFMKMTGISDPYDYDCGINAGISSVFGAAAFRFGHSQINPELKVHSGHIFNISDTFFKPSIAIETEGYMKNIILNQAKARAMKCDHFFPTEVLDHMFQDVDAPGLSFDLPGLAVQRCRDHGLPPWKDYVNLCIQAMAGAHSGTTNPVSNLNLPLCLISGVYEAIDDVDVFTGSLYESHVNGGIVGPTFAYLIGEQFSRLKHGDRFWYETTDPKIGFTTGQLEDIKKKGSLANVLCKNSILGAIHPLSMETRRFQGKKDCSSYPDFDWQLWKETTV